MATLPAFTVDSLTRSLMAPPPLRPAPTFYPTEEQFRDPLQFVRSIRHIGEKTGICKIVPPKSWRPPFCLNEDKFTFRSKVQRLDLLQKRGHGGGVEESKEDDEERDDPASSPTGRAKRTESKRKAASVTKSASAVRRSGKRAKAASADKYTHTQCEICAGADHDEKILLCDECDQGFHIFCLSPPLASIPTSDWFCPQCLAEKISAFGFDMGRTFTLRQFRQHSESFMRQWFTPKTEAAAAAAPAPPGLDSTFVAVVTSPAVTSSPLGDVVMSDVGAPLGDAAAAVSSSSAPQPAAASSAPPLPTPSPAAAPFVRPSPAAISDAFWRILEQSHSKERVSVDYGSDLDTEILGSGFPKDGPYASLPWNVNNLAMCKGAVSNWQDDSMLSGVTIPWLYVGMLFSTFCWHVEDHWMYSINYSHYLPGSNPGAAKQWYGVSSHCTGKFERKMRQALPNLFNLNPDLLFQLVTMISPLKLATHAADATGSAASASAGADSDDPALYYLLQNPGEFVITFPRSYHAGFNHGFNVAESVNFSGAEWAPYGLKCIERYRFFRRAPIFCHEELIMRMTHHVISAFESVVLKPKGQALRKKHQLANASAQKMFEKNVAQISTAAASPLQAIAQLNQKLSLSTFVDIWYFAAWLLHQLQELLARETSGRLNLQLADTVRGRLWSSTQGAAKKALAGVGADGKSKTFTPISLGTHVNATWQGNSAFNHRAPADEGKLIYYEGTVIGWNAAQSLYSVRFHEDGLVDDRVLPRHVKLKNSATTVGGVAAGKNNDWLSFQACVDDGENGPNDNPQQQQSAPAQPATMKLKKKSAVDFTAVSNLEACVICRHALYLSCVRCSCSPEKASCLMHAHELCGCNGISKAVHFRYTLWQLQNLLDSIQQVVNHREVDSDSSSAATLTARGTVTAEKAAAAASETPAAPAVAPRAHPIKRASYNALTDTFECGTSADDYPTRLSHEDASVFAVLGENDDGPVKHPLSFSTLMPVFAMNLDDVEEAQEMMFDTAPVVAASGAAAKADPEDIAASRSLEHSRPSNQALSAILMESRRIMSDEDEYVTAVGLHDDRLVKSQAARDREEAAAERFQPRRLEAQMTATTRSAHTAKLRSAARISQPSAVVAALQETAAATEARRQRVQSEAEAWVSKYSPWLRRAQEARTRFEADEQTRDDALAATTRSSAVAAAPSSAAPVAASTPAGDTPMLDESKESPATEESKNADAMTDVAQSAVAAPVTTQPAVAASAAPMDVSLLSAPAAPAFHSYSFLTAAQLDIALHEGERFISGDESMLPACELYGVLLSWQVNAARMSAQLCALQKTAASLKGRMRRVRDLLDTECANVAVGSAATEELPQRLPKDSSLMEPESAARLRRQAAYSPLTLVCQCAVNTAVIAAPAFPGIQPSDVTASMLSSWSHVEALRPWIARCESLHASMGEQVQRDFVSSLPGPASMASEEILASANAFQATMKEHFDRLQEAVSLPLKVARDTIRGAYYALLQQALARRRAAHRVPTPAPSALAVAVKAPRSKKPRSTPQEQAAPLSLWQQMMQDPTLLQGMMQWPSMQQMAAATFFPAHVPLVPLTIAPPAAQPYAFSVFDVANSHVGSIAGVASAHLAAPLDGFRAVTPVRPSVPTDPATGAPAAFLPLTAAVWMKTVQTLISDTNEPPLLATLYSYKLRAEQLFPSIRPLLAFDTAATQRLSVLDSMPANELADLDLVELRRTLHALVHICWAGWWWLTQARRVLVRMAKNSLCVITPIATHHDDDTPAADLDAMAVPTALATWARGSNEGVSYAVAGHTSLPWCHDRASHLSLAQVKKALQTTSEGGSDTVHRFSTCCAHMLRSAPVLQVVEIPELQLLDHALTAAAEYADRARPKLPAAVYRHAGIQPSADLLAREELAQKRTPDTTAVNVRSHHAGCSEAQVCGLAWEGAGLGVMPIEAFLMESYRQRVQEWRKEAAHRVMDAHETLRQAQESTPVVVTSDDSVRQPISAVMLDRLVGELQRLMREAEALGLWSEEGLTMRRLWEKANHILHQSYGRPKPVPAPRAAAEPVSRKSGPRRPSVPSLPPAAVRSSSQIASTAAAAASSTSTSAAMDDAPPSFGVTSLDTLLGANVRTVGQMLDRVAFARTDAILQQLPKELKETHQGFSMQTYGRYQRHMKNAEQCGIDLEQYRELPFSSLPMLISATPQERQQLLLAAQAAGGSWKRGPAPLVSGGGDIAEGAEDAGDSGESDDDDDSSVATPRRRGRRASRPSFSLPIDADPSVVLMGHTPVEELEVLALPPPTAAQLATHGNVYCGAVGQGPNSERKRLLNFCRQFVCPDGLLPTNGPQYLFGKLHRSRKQRAIRLVQDEFGTGASWTRKFLATMHGNNHRIFMEKYGGEAFKQQRRQQQQQRSERAESPSDMPALIRVQSSSPHVPPKREAAAMKHEDVQMKEEDLGEEDGVEDDEGEGEEDEQEDEQKAADASS